MPVVIGAGGVERIVEIDLSGEDRAAFGRSVEAVRELVGAANAMRSAAA